MEQTTSRVNWRDVNVAKAPGQMRLWSYQAVARGADGVMFFQWRQSRAGAEKFHSAMVPHGPVESSPAWKEAKQLGQRAARPRRGVRQPRARRRGDRSRLGVVVGARAALQAVEPHPPGVAARGLLPAAVRRQHRRGLRAAGGRPVRLQAGARSKPLPGRRRGRREPHRVREGRRQRRDVVLQRCRRPVRAHPSGRLPGALPRTCSGCASLDWLPLADGEQLEVVFADGGKGRCDLWSELIEPSGAEVVATFAGSRVDKRPAVTRHKFGSGSAYLRRHPAGSAFDGAPAADRSAPKPESSRASTRLPAWRRCGATFGHRSILFLLNHRPAHVDVPLSAGRHQPGRRQPGPCRPVQAGAVRGGRDPRGLVEAHLRAITVR